MRVGEDGGALAQRAQPAREQRLETREVIEPHLIDRDDQYEPGPLDSRLRRAGSPAIAGRECEERNCTEDRERSIQSHFFHTPASA
jgi:hypothetical protein